MVTWMKDAVKIAEIGVLGIFYLYNYGYKSSYDISER